MRLLRVGLLGALVMSGCVPSSVSSERSESSVVSQQGRASNSIAALAAPFRDYRLGIQRSTRTACASETFTGDLRYVETLEYIDSPPVTFGLDSEDCIREIRVDYATGAGRYEHAVTLATQRLGSPEGDHRARCPATGDEIVCTYWMTEDGRFEVVRSGVGGDPEFVLRSSEAPFSYSRLCEGGVATD